MAKLPNGEEVGGVVEEEINCLKVAYKAADRIKERDTPFLARWYYLKTMI